MAKRKKLKRIQPKPIRARDLQFVPDSRTEFSVSVDDLDSDMGIVVYNTRSRSEAFKRVQAFIARLVAGGRK